MLALLAGVEDVAWPAARSVLSLSVAQHAFQSEGVSCSLLPVASAVAVPCLLPCMQPPASPRTLLPWWTRWSPTPACARSSCPRCGGLRSVGLGCSMSVQAMVLQGHLSAVRSCSRSTCNLPCLPLHPAFQVDGQRCQLHLATLNIIIGLSRAQHLQV